MQLRDSLLCFNDLCMQSIFSLQTAIWYHLGARGDHIFEWGRGPLVPLTTAPNILNLYTCIVCTVFPFIYYSIVCISFLCVCFCTFYRSCSFMYWIFLFSLGFTHSALFVYSAVKAASLGTDLQNILRFVLKLSTRKIDRKSVVSFPLVILYDLSCRRCLNNVLR